MARLSDTIETFIKSLMEEYDEIIELQRNELATYFSCAPSQINYVLATRFSPEKGYIIESKRGGGGYIRLIRVNPDRHEYIYGVIDEKLKDGRISQKDAALLIMNLEALEWIDEKTAKVLIAMTTDKAVNVPSSIKDNIRASVLKEGLLALLGEE
ncbi:MAG: CtsR family transcriptional regulator [Christensenellaceae bacterium]